MAETLKTPERKRLRQAHIDGEDVHFCVLAKIQKGFRHDVLDAYVSDMSAEFLLSLADGQTEQDSYNDSFVLDYPSQLLLDHIWKRKTISIPKDTTTDAEVSLDYQTYDPNRVKLSSFCRLLTCLF